MALAVNPSIAAPPTVAQVRADLRTYYAWINAPWTEDDQPYQRIREDMKRARANGQTDSELLKQYQAAWAKAPHDPRAQFGYYYAAYRVATASDVDNPDIGLQVLSHLSTELIRTPHPHTYNYARLAFLCDQYNWINPKLKALGLRLVRRDPADYLVKFYTVYTLSATASPADRALAVTYAQDLIRRNPQKSNSYFLLAAVHYQAWLATKDRKEAAQAVDAYQQYLQHAPPDSPFRKHTQELIAQLKKG